MTIGPVTGKSKSLEKSYLRLTEDARASDVRPVAVLKQAFDRLVRIYGNARENKRGEDKIDELIDGIHDGITQDAEEKKPTWWYVSDQLRAIRQDLLVQNVENRFVSKVYAQNAAWAVRVGDLGQFHQCCMQLKVRRVLPDS